MYKPRNYKLLSCPLFLAVSLVILKTKKERGKEGWNCEAGEERKKVINRKMGAYLFSRTDKIEQKQNGNKWQTKLNNETVDVS